MSTGVQGGNIQSEWVAQVTLSPASVAANTSAEQAFTLVGVRPYHNINVNKPSTQAGLAVVSARAGTDQIFIAFGNFTASPIVPTASEVYNIAVMAPEANNPVTKLGF
jgi:hypothetical protein